MVVYCYGCGSSVGASTCRKNFWLKLISDGRHGTVRFGYLYKLAPGMAVGPKWKETWRVMGQLELIITFAMCTPRKWKMAGLARAGRLYFPLVKAVTSPQSPPLALFLHSNQHSAQWTKSCLEHGGKKSPPINPTDYHQVPMHLLMVRFSSFELLLL